MSSFHGGDKGEEKAFCFPDRMGGHMGTPGPGTLYTGAECGVNALEGGMAKESESLLLRWLLLLESRAPPRVPLGRGAGGSPRGPLGLLCT